MKRAFVNINIFSLIKQDGKTEWEKQQQSKGTKKRLFRFFVCSRMAGQAVAAESEANVENISLDAGIKTQHEY